MTEVVTGVNLADFFTKVLASTEALDYGEALDWIGLRFAPGGDPATRWRLQVRPDATDAPREPLRAWMAAER